MKSGLAAALVTACVIACGASGQTGAKRGVDAQGRPLPASRRGDEGRGASLTGEHGYDDRHDPSGWSGKTAPTSVGGGPAPSTSTPAPPPPSALPPSKELDTSPPSKELEF